MPYSSWMNLASVITFWYFLVFHFWFSPWIFRSTNPDPWRSKAYATSSLVIGYALCSSLLAITKFSYPGLLTALQYLTRLRWMWWSGTSMQARLFTLAGGVLYQQSVTTKGNSPAQREAAAKQGREDDTTELDEENQRLVSSPKVVWGIRPLEISSFVRQSAIGTVSKGHITLGKSRDSIVLVEGILAWAHSCICTLKHCMSVYQSHYVRPFWHFQYFTSAIKLHGSAMMRFLSLPKSHIEAHLLSEQAIYTALC